MYHDKRSIMSQSQAVKGIDKILGKFSHNQDDISNISINLIEPDSAQPRKTFDERSIDELAGSIQNHGVLQPILVQKKDHKYVIIAGERRFRACQKAGLMSIPAKIVDLTPEKKMEVSLIENLQREDLNPLEIANSIYALIQQFNKTQEDIAKILSKSRSYIANMLRLLHLPGSVQESIRSGKLSLGHAKILAGLDNAEPLAKEIVQKNLSVRETEKRAARTKNPRVVQDDLLYIQDSIEKKFNLKTKIEMLTAESGRIILKFENLNELAKILAH